MAISSWKGSAFIRRKRLSQGPEQGLDSAAVGVVWGEGLAAPPRNHVDVVTAHRDSPLLRLS